MPEDFSVRRKALEEYKTLESLKAAVKKGTIEGRTVTIGGEKFTKAELKKLAIELANKESQGQIASYGAYKELLNSFKKDLDSVNSKNIIYRIKNALINQQIKAAGKELDKEVKFREEQIYDKEGKTELKAKLIGYRELDECNVLLVQSGLPMVSESNIQEKKDEYLKMLVVKIIREELRRENINDLGKLSNVDIDTIARKLKDIAPGLREEFEKMPKDLGENVPDFPNISDNKTRELMSKLVTTADLVKTNITENT